MTGDEPEKTGEYWLSRFLILRPILSGASARGSGWGPEGIDIRTAHSAAPLCGHPVPVEGCLLRGVLGEADVSWLD